MGDRDRVARWAADAAAIVGIGTAIAAVAAHGLDRHVPLADVLPEDTRAMWLVNATLAVTWVVPGWFLARRRPGVVFGWLALAAGLGHGLSALGQEWAVAAVVTHRHLPAPTLGLWFASWGMIAEQPVLMAAYGVYPDGRLPRGWKKVAVIISVGLAAAGVLFAMLDRSPGSGDAPILARLHNPVSLPLPTTDALIPALFVPSALIISVVLLVRWRQATGDDRRVLTWIVAVAIPCNVLVPVAIGIDPVRVGPLVAQATTLLEIAVIVAGSLRNHVYGIDVVLNRALVYGVLTAVVTAVYGVVVGLGSMAGDGGASTVSFVAAMAAAVVLLPARTRIQRAVNRLLYGERDDPYAVLARVATELEAAGSAEQLLPALVDSAATALRVPFVAIQLGGPDGGHIVATRAPATPAISTSTGQGAADRVPLVHHGVVLGELVVGRRPGQTSVPERERELIENMARQAAVAVANVRLTEDLRRSRERIVTAQEEERRRLRNDLHDGLGPQLTGVALGLDVLADAVPPATGATLDQLRGELEDAISDIRRLVHGLRPPRLDDAGLAGALREAAARAERSGLAVELEVPADALSLPAAVEVAAYRIATEALTNVVRHAAATRCRLALSLEHGEGDGDGAELRIEVLDDGRGANGAAAGVGMSSMRERAEELGGSVTIGPGDADGAGPGCRLVARLPMRATGEATRRPAPQAAHR